MNTSLAALAPLAPSQTTDDETAIRAAALVSPRRSKKLLVATWAVLQAQPGTQLFQPVEEDTVRMRPTLVMLPLAVPRAAETVFDRRVFAAASSVVGAALKITAQTAACGYCAMLLNVRRGCAVRVVRSGSPLALAAPCTIGVASTEQHSPLLLCHPDRTPQWFTVDDGCRRRCEIPLPPSLGSDALASLLPPGLCVGFDDACPTEKYSAYQPLPPCFTVALLTERLVIAWNADDWPRDPLVSDPRCTAAGSVVIPLPVTPGMACDAVVLQWAHIEDSTVSLGTVR
jgi:hypothetical protein